jgi:CDP-diglyceride synthetase
MTLNWNRVLSGLLAVVYLVAAFCGDGAEAGFKAAIFLVLPLACIWFSDAMGGYIGPAAGGPITNPTPGLMICIAGWLLLLLPVLSVIIYALTNSRD